MINTDLLPGASICLNLVLNYLLSSHLDPPANGQAVFYLTGLLEVFISELSIFGSAAYTNINHEGNRNRNLGIEVMMSDIHDCNIFLPRGG